MLTLLLLATLPVTGEITFPAGAHTLPVTLEVCPPAKVSGAGSYFTTLTTVGRRTAIHVLPYEECRDRGATWHGPVVISGFTIKAGASTSTAPIVRGVWAENHAKIVDVLTDGFTHGVEISADVTRPVAGNANGWRMDGVRAQKAEHAGVYVHGGDTNVGVWTQGSAGSNCKKASLFPTLPRCAGLIESSFLGSTYIGISTATNWEMLPGCTKESLSCRKEAFPGIRFAGNSQRSLCLGCYMESDQAAGEISQESIALGGLSTWQGPGLRLSGTKASGLTLTNAKDPANVAVLRLGSDATTQATFLEMYATGISVAWPLRLKANAATKEYRLDVGNLNTAVTALIMGYTGMAYPMGSIKLKLAP